MAIIHNDNALFVCLHAQGGGDSESRRSRGDLQESKSEGVLARIFRHREANREQGLKRNPEPD